MQLITKKSIKKVISQKKIKNLGSFAIIFKNNTLIILARISRSQFLNLNEKTFLNKTLPSNIYFYNFGNLKELTPFLDNIILIKYNSQYFYPNQLDYLLLDKNLSKINSCLGFYKKFYTILKTISVKK